MAFESTSAYGRSPIGSLTGAVSPVSPSPAQNVPVDFNSLSFPQTGTNPDDPTNNPFADLTHPTIPFSADFTGIKDSLTPAEQLKAALSLKDAERQARAQQLRELNDRETMSLIADHQKNLQKHQAYLGGQLQQLHEELGHPPEIQAAQAMGAGLAGLFGGPSANIAALGGAQLNANRDWQIRQAQGQNQQAFLQQQYSNDSRQLENWDNTEYGEKVRQYQEQVQADKEAAAEEEQRVKDQIGEAHLKIQEEEEARKTTLLGRQLDQQTAADAKSDWDRLENLYKLRGELSPDEKLQADQTVDRLNAKLESVGAEKLPYLPQGKTESARAHEAQNLTRQSAIEQAGKRLDEMMVNNYWQHEDRVAANDIRKTLGTDRNTIARERAGVMASIQKKITDAATSLQAAIGVSNDLMPEYQQELADAQAKGDSVATQAAQQKIDGLKKSVVKAQEKANAIAQRGGHLANKLQWQNKLFEYQQKMEKVLKDPRRTSSEKALARKAFKEAKDIAQKAVRELDEQARKEAAGIAKPQDNPFGVKQ
jgi:hypothetical protein